MSSIKTTQLDGDASIGRNVNIGGKVEIAGRARIGHNLRVDGWLDAKNIKGANKGVFPDIDKLREAYPDGTLADGSWAIVGATLPGELWYVSGGKWLDSGTSAGAITVDMEQYQEGLEAVNEAIIKLQTAVNTLVAGNVSDAIDNFNEVIAFLEGIKDNEKLTSKLVELQKEIDKKQDPATTLAGYGITDAYTKQEADTLLEGKADKATTLDGYGITDAYTKQEADTLLEGKADKAATLAGYGIADAYTKAEVDALIRSIEGAIAEDANESDIDEIINQL